MSSRISSVGRALTDDVPSTLDPTAPSCVINTTQDSTAGVNVGSDGNIDWWWFGTQSAANVPFGIGPQSLNMKRFGTGWLRNGFRWQFGSTSGYSATSIASSRTITVPTMSDNIQNNPSVQNSSNRTGYQSSVAGAILNAGWQLSLPISENQRRLRAYIVMSQADITLNAKVLNNDGRTATATGSVLSPVGTTKHGIFEVLFSGSSLGGRLILDARVTNHDTNSNYGIQAFTLNE